MIGIRTMAAAILENHGDILMMKRAPDRLLAPGFWAPVGGHLEEGEYTAPLAACLREIAEETGLKESDLVDIRLRYIMLRMAGSEIRHQYVYSATSLRRDVHQTREGQLYWLPKASIIQLEMYAATRFSMERYLACPRPDDGIWAGVLTPSDDLPGTPAVTWSRLSDWEKQGT